jgi:triphosphoribosyl-dephospho-CoA synthase
MIMLRQPVPTCAPPADHAELLSIVAVESLIAECNLTPKPGLVDARGPGSHTDMTVKLLRLSARCLHPTFLASARAAAGQPPSLTLREELGRVGRRGEATMMAVTSGVNTHRGAIWTLGMLTAAAASLRKSEWSAHLICSRAAEIARISDRYVPRAFSHGTQVCRRFGVGGARGEAEAGFPHVLLAAAPRLERSLRSGESDRVARINALLALMAELADTCILYRGGLHALKRVQEGARQVLKAGGAGTPEGMKCLLRLDGMLAVQNLSPGGSADLLAATLFLDSLKAHREGT